MAEGRVRGFLHCCNQRCNDLSEHCWKKAGELRCSLNAMGDLVGRYGGEEPEGDVQALAGAARVPAAGEPAHSDRPSLHVNCPGKSGLNILMDHQAARKRSFYTLLILRIKTLEFRMDFDTVPIVAKGRVDIKRFRSRKRFSYTGRPPIIYKYYHDITPIFYDGLHTVLVI